MTQMSVLLSEQPAKLDEILRQRDRKALEKVLTAYCESPVSIASEGSAASGRALYHDLECVGYVETDNSVALAGVMPLVQMIIDLHAKYLLASRMHGDVVHLDYAELEKKHAALQKSEQQYRDLSAELEERVQRQISVISEQHRQLYFNERLASVGQLAAGVAHEINNPISFVINNLRVAGDYVAEISASPFLAPASDDAGLQRTLADFPVLLDEALAGAERISAIVQQLRTFSDIDRDSFGRVDPVAVTELAASLIRPSLGENIELIVDIDHDVRDESALFDGAAAALGQAIMNLLDNARLACGDGGQIHVRLGRDQAQVVLEITDTGCGIAPKDLSRVFDPFFTRRPIGGGVGLGLTVARDVVKGHGGRLSLHSDGQGTRVEIVIPLGRAGETS